MVSSYSRPDGYGTAAKPTLDTSLPTPLTAQSSSVSYLDETQSLSTSTQRPKITGESSRTVRPRRSRATKWTIVRSAKL